MTVVREAPLCWGQRYIWLDHEHLPPGARGDYNITTRHDLLPGTDLDRLRAILDHVVRRHEALRTTYHVDGGRGGPVQRVHPPGPFPLTLFDTAQSPAADAAASPAAFLNRFETEPFDLERDWPVRACVVLTGGRPVRLVLVTHHAAVDHWSIDRLERELQALYQGVMTGRPASLPPVTRHPADLAAEEASPRGADTSRRAVAYWDRHAATMPADPFAHRRTGAAGAHSASLTSPAMRAAAHRIAERHGVWPALVHGAAFAALLSAYTGVRPVYFKTFVHNRDSAGHDDVLSCRFQPALVCVDGGEDPPLPALVDATARGTEAAMAHGACAFDEALEAVSRRGFERGMRLRIGTEFNFLSHAPRSLGVRRTIFGWTGTPQSWPLQDNDVHLEVSEWQDCVVAMMSVQASVMTADDLERFLRGMQTLLVEYEAGASPRPSEIAKLVGFGAVPAAGDVDLVDATVVAPADVAACLRTHPAVADAAAFVVAGADGAPRLRAYAVPADPHAPPTVTALRTHLLGRLADQPRVCCPHEMVVCRDAPPVTGEGPPDEYAWAARPVVDPGDQHGGDVAASDAERALADCLGDLLGSPPSLADSYVVAGGRVMDVPRLRRSLRDRGWHAPDVYAFVGERPLRALAAALTPLG